MNKSTDFLKIIKERDFKPSKYKGLKEYKFDFKDKVTKEIEANIEEERIIEETYLEQLRHMNDELETKLKYIDEHLAAIDAWLNKIIEQLTPKEETN